jgi:haloalkane dehalogenase
MHYIETGSGDPILFLHGNPTWSYLWRNIIPFAALVGRAIAPDLIGMGKSDKPNIEYRFFEHSKYIEEFIRILGLENICLVVHDWGSALGFYYSMRNPEKVRSIVFMEAILFASKLSELPEPLRSQFRLFRTPGVGWDMIVNQNVFLDNVLPHGIVRKLTKEEIDRYQEPFVENSSRKPMWRWVNEFPFDGRPKDMNDTIGSYVEWLKHSELPKLLFYGEPGTLITKDRVRWCEENLRNFTAMSIGPGLHHLQEDNPHFIGRNLVEWYSKTCL